MLESSIVAVVSLGALASGVADPGDTILALTDNEARNERVRVAQPRRRSAARTGSGVRGAADQPGGGVTLLSCPPVMSL